MDKLTFALALTLISQQVIAAESDNQQMLDTEITNTQLSAPPSCTMKSDIDVNAIKTKYTDVINSEKSKIVQEVNAIKNSRPELNAGEAAVQVDFVFRDEQMEVIFDLPVVTMVDTPMAMDLPEVTMKTQSLSWDVPQTTMELQCTPGVPETVIEGATCETFGISYSCPRFVIRPGKDICLHSPVITINRQEVALDVPEVTMKRQDWLIGVPETKMERQRVVFNYPALVVTDVKTASANMDMRGQVLAQRSKDTFSGISAAMKSEITLASMRNVDKSFSCQKKQLGAQMRKVYDDLNALSSGAQASVDRARAMNATPEVMSTLSASSQKLNEAKKALLTQYANARRDIESKRKEVLAKMNDSLGQQQSVATMTQ